MTFVICGWKVVPLEDWYTDDGRIAITHIYDGMWEVDAYNDEDYQLSQQSGLYAARFTGPRVAARAAHQILGTSMALTRSIPPKYLIEDTGWIIFRPDTMWQLDWLDYTVDMTEQERQLDGHQATTLRGIVEHMAQVLQSHE